MGVRINCPMCNKPLVPGDELVQPPAESALTAARERIAVLEEALRACITTMGHAEVFVNSRQRIKQPEGADLYAECLVNARAALSDTGHRETDDG